MIQNLQLVDKKNNYKITRIKRNTFAQEIISKSNENILKNYIYIEKRRIIA